LVSLAQVVLAIVFGCIGIGRASRVGRGKGQAIAGLICGIAGGLLYFLIGILTLGVGFII
jgi:lipopolysaccharide export LptBFGC system permease protein LptF